MVDELGERLTTLKLTPEQEFDCAVVMRELYRNADRQVRRDLSLAGLVFRITDDSAGLHFLDNAGGFLAEAARGLRGEGTGLMGQIAEASGMKLTHSPIEGGTDFYLTIPPVMP